MSDVRELIRLDPSQDEHDAIRRLWKRHSVAEDNRDLPGLLATLTDDCVYELVQTGHRWEGHDGAARFYGGLLGSFPDIHFQLTGIVIGPQGVCEEADVTGTHEAEWLGVQPTGERHRLEGDDLLPVGPRAAPLQRRARLHGRPAAPGASRLTAARGAHPARARCRRDGCGGRSGRSRLAGRPRSA